MNGLYMLSNAEHIILILISVMTISLAIVALGTIMRYHSGVVIYIIGFATVLIGFFLLERIASTYISIGRLERAHSAFSWPTWTIWMICLILLAWSIAENIIFRMNIRPNVNSIKEALDNFPEGVCYFDSNGDVRLCNHQMYVIYSRMTRDELKNYGILKKNLENCEDFGQIRRDKKYINMYVFADGSVKEYKETTVRDRDGNVYTEARFADVTEYYNAGLELNRQTRNLRNTSEELKELSDNAIALTRENELLSAKTRLHDQMGAALIMIRKAITEPDSEIDSGQIVARMRSAVSSIQSVNAYDKSRDELKDFLWNAKAVGVRVNMEGNLPKDNTVSDIFMNVIRECLTNAVKHAEADNLGIVIIEDETENRIRVSANGTMPDKPIVPRGGLKNLNRYILKSGGRMKITVDDRVVVEVSIPTLRNQSLL